MTAAVSSRVDPSVRYPLPLPPEAGEAVLAKRIARYDKGGEEHYNIISALHKAVRGSDVEGALYWLARMVIGGEDPLYLARRIVRMAAEDIGLADPRALSVALAAKDSYHFLGTPEGELALAEAVIYLAVDQLGDPRLQPRSRIPTFHASPRVSSPGPMPSRVDHVA